MTYTINQQRGHLIPSPRYVFEDHFITLERLCREDAVFGVCLVGVSSKKGTFVGVVYEKFPSVVWNKEVFVGNGESLSPRRGDGQAINLFSGFQSGAFSLLGKVDRGLYNLPHAQRLKVNGIRPPFVQGFQVLCIKVGGYSHNVDGLSSSKLRLGSRKAGGQSSKGFLCIGLISLCSDQRSCQRKQYSLFTIDFHFDLL